MLCPVFSAYSVLKFMIVWMLVLLADFVLEFRLEYLWPCWLFLGTVYTTFHCHGLVMQHAIVLFTFRIITKLGLWLKMNFLVPFFFLIYDILICSAAFMCISNYIKQNETTNLCFSFAGHLCGFCVCSIYPGLILFNFCTLTLVVFCSQHICLTQLYVAYR